MSSQPNEEATIGPILSRCRSLTDDLLVIGSRMRGGSDELFSSISEVVRLFGSTVISLTINYRFGVRLTDYQNGFRAIRTCVGRQIGLRADITTPNWPP